MKQFLCYLSLLLALNSLLASASVQRPNRHVNPLRDLRRGGSFGTRTSAGSNYGDSPHTFYNEVYGQEQSCTNQPEVVECQEALNEEMDVFYNICVFIFGVTIVGTCVIVICKNSDACHRPQEERGNEDMRKNQISAKTKQQQKPVKVEEKYDDEYYSESEESDESYETEPEKIKDAPPLKSTQKKGITPQNRPIGHGFTSIVPKKQQYATTFNASKQRSGVVPYSETTARARQSRQRQNDDSDNDSDNDSERDNVTFKHIKEGSIDSIQRQA